ncbi:MAG TPA: hypothetical protein VMI32_16430 [Candidatus Solibacter sp.]|nr:hypothetical protein [Candidatus Solibacter sp.]
MTPGANEFGTVRAMDELRRASDRSGIGKQMKADRAAQSLIRYDPAES